MALALRILYRLQNPPKGGTPSDWRTWAQSAVDNFGRSLGVSRAYVYLVKKGGGSVSVVPLIGGSGIGRDPGATVASQILTFLNTLRVATDTVYVDRPYFPSNSALSIVVRVRPAVGYTYDVDDTGWAGTSVVSYSTNTIVISTVTPATLNTAVTNGTTPRIQLQISGQALPLVARVTAFVDNSPMGGQATLTLDTAPTATPTLMYAGGGAVMPCSIALLAYVDALGPSLQSGYADPGDSWSDVCSVGGAAQAVLDATGSDGRRCLALTPNVGNDPSQSVGVTIAVGSGTPASLDVEAQDFSPTNGPQLLTAASILVIKG